jgi:MmeI, N-terminal domain
MAHFVANRCHTPVKAFISRWETSGAAERANYQLFLCQLCKVLEVPEPEPAKADSSQNTYVFEHPVLFDDGLGQTSTGFIDLYRRGHFILEGPNPTLVSQGAK